MISLDLMLRRSVSNPPRILIECLTILNFHTILDLEIEALRVHAYDISCGTKKFREDFSMAVSFSAGLNNTLVIITGYL